MNITRTVIAASVLLLAAGVAPSAQAHGWEHGGWGHGGGGPRWSIGLNFGFPLYDPYPVPYYGYYGAPVVYAPQPVVVAPPPSQVVYQYYCPSSSAYYPSVPTCSQPWLKVLPDGSTYN